MDGSGFGDDVRAGVLCEAERLVNGDRNAQYGDPIQGFRRVAVLWGEYLGGRLGEGVVLLPHDVAVMMVLLKVSRLVHSPDKLDSWVDVAGYAACGADCVVRTLDDDGGV